MVYLIDPNEFCNGRGCKTRVKPMYGIPICPENCTPVCALIM